MKRFLPLAALLFLPTSALAELPKPIVEGLRTPESVCVTPDGRIFVTVMGEFGKDGDGSVVQVVSGKAQPFTTGLDDPKGIVAFGPYLYVADKDRILRIGVGAGAKGFGKPGTPDLFVPPNAFPIPPLFLNDITVDPESGNLYVSDTGDLKGHGGAVYRITPQGLVTLVADEKTIPGLNLPNGVLLDGASHLLLADFGTGNLFRIKLATGATEKIADGLGSPDGLAWDFNGRLYVSDYKGGKVYVIPRPGDKPVLIAEGFGQAADLCFDPVRKQILVPDMKNGIVVPIAAEVPGAAVDTSPMPVAAALAFPDLKWTGWNNDPDAGKVQQLRPILLTHAGDGSNRIFVPTQQGVIHVFPNDQKAKETKVFIDLQDRVRYSDATNEEGFLGMAFHPKYKQNGEFFVFYTTKKEPLTNVVSRFRVSKDDPDKADPASEQEIIRFKKPYWNHDGGTICFGPDGMLYITHGDGGAGNDLHDNGQNTNSLLGKILRLDINGGPPNGGPSGKNYLIPKDNPFVDAKDARPEVWAYGFRNIWRMSFDRKTGQLWAADVGQNLYEEIDLVHKGGNYGWNRREGLHPFGGRGTGPKKDYLDPIWEYHHDVGKSITGGFVYRGTRLPELDGYYLYGDYVSSRMWALKFDDQANRVVANRPVKDPNLPIYSFGEDEQGEVYFLTATNTGKGIYWFVK